MCRYFPHEASAHRDKKLKRLRAQHGMRGYGLYFLLLELLMDEEDNALDAFDGYKSVAMMTGVPKRLIKSVVEDFGLFVMVDREGHEVEPEEAYEFYSLRQRALVGKIERTRAEANTRIEAEEALPPEEEERQRDISEKRREAGRKSAEARWGKDSEIQSESAQELSESQITEKENSKNNKPNNKRIAKITNVDFVTNDGNKTGNKTIAKGGDYRGGKTPKSLEIKYSSITPHIPPRGERAEGGAVCVGLDGVERGEEMQGAEPVPGETLSQETSPAAPSAPESKTPKGKRQAFQPPTPQEVQAYIDSERPGADFSGAEFCDYFATTGWRTSSGVPLKDWRAAVRSWVARKAKETPPHVPRPATPYRTPPQSQAYKLDVNRQCAEYAQELPPETKAALGIQ